MNCNHASKVLEWAYDSKMNPYASKYGCTRCDETSERPFVIDDDIFIDHSDCEENPCFGCKAKKIQLSTGDANGKRIMSSKSFDGELNSYYDATRQGIEPVSTKRKDIEAAVRLSNDTGTAFNGNDI